MKSNRPTTRGIAWGRKGFIFTLDIVLGSIVLFILLGTSLFLVSRASEVSLSEQQILETGSDITALLDREQVLTSLDAAKIKLEMEKVLPPNYGMLLRIQGNFSSGNGVLEAGQEIPAATSVYSGRRVALTPEGQYLKVTYLMWVKQQ